jgi:uncharacterized protein (TIGR02466 family)
MALTEYDIQPLFATPYFRAQVGHAISQKQIEFIKNLKMVQSRANLISEDLYIFNLPELKSISDVIQEALDIYASQILGIKQKLYVTQSWSITNSSGAGMHPHSHSNSLVSGSLYYTDLPEPVARVIYDRHVMYQQLELAPESDKRNLYNTPVNIVTPKKHEVLMFPSDINHMIEPNDSEQLRHCIAFNCFIKGKIGNYRDISELVL